MKRHRLALTFLLAFFLPTLALAQELPEAEGSQETIVILVRHAEKASDGTTDPPLTEVGHARAVALASLLRDVGITHIFSTDYKRTLQTAAPLADSLDLTVETYRPRLLSELAEQLKAMPGRHLVVGHSNSTPDLVQLLGGEATEISESEYDRLYFVIIGETTQMMLLRYGAVSGH